MTFSSQEPNKSQKDGSRFDLVNYIKDKTITPDELDNFEATVTMEKLFQMQREPVHGSFDLKHLSAIHKYIFEDVYTFAGSIRNVNISKDCFWFCNAMYIQDEAKRIFGELKNEGYLKSLETDMLCSRLAYFMSEINLLHPFREGNGRTTREFIRCLAVNAGYDIDWSKVGKEELMQASIRSHFDIEPLAKVIEKCLVG